MSNWKLALWAALGRRPLCETCGELYATTTITDPAGTRPACEHCAAWVAGGSPEDYDLGPWQDACDSLPWLLRYRPGVRVLNCSNSAWNEAQGEQAKHEAYEQLSRDYQAALWSTRMIWHAGQCLGQCRDETRFRVGSRIDPIRLAVFHPDCARCGKPATTTTRLRDEHTVDGVPVCDTCVINAAYPLPAGGAR